MSTNFGVTIKRRFESKVLDKLNNNAIKVILREVGDVEIDLIRKRTNAGRDRNGRPFRPYSKRYIKTKQRAIRNGAGRTIFAATRFNQWMRLSGRMFNDMRIQNIKFSRTSRGVTASYKLGFKTARSARIAEYHNESGAGRRRVKRRWLGRVKTEREVKLLERAWRREIRKSLKR